MNMSEVYNRRFRELKEQLDSLSKRIDMFEGLDIQMNVIDMPNDLLYTAQRIISHAESEIEGIYHILYRIKIDQMNKDKEEL